MRRAWLPAILLLTALVGVSGPAPAQQPEPTDTEASAEATATATPGPEEELPGQVRALKEKVIESRARLLMLPEEIHGTLPTEASLELQIHNQLPGDFRLEHVVASLDGEPLLERTFSPGDDTRQITHRIPVKPGAHKLQMKLSYRGNGRGLFPYMSAYEIQLDSDYPFVVPDQMVAGVTATVYSDNPLKKHWKQRPKVRFVLEESALLPRMSGAPPSTPGQPTDKQ